MYVDPGQPAFSGKKSVKLRQLMQLIPLMDKPTSIDYISKVVGLNKKKILSYLSKWKEKNLIDIYWYILMYYNYIKIGIFFNNQWKGFCLITLKSLKAELLL